MIMKTKINNLLSVLILLLMTSCKGQNKELTMEKITEEILKLVHSYNTTPVYSMQMNKQGCKLIVEMEDNLDYRLTENTGTSIMLPLNVMISKSGKQTAIIKIYPKEGDPYITKYAHAKITIYNAPNKDSGLKDYKKIAEFTLPEGLEEKKLPYYEHTIVFDATVPFDYAKELNHSQNLKNIPSIEQKVVKKYEEVRNICEQYDFIKYNELLIHNSGLVYNATYTSVEEIKKKESKNQFGMVEKGLADRKLLPIKDYYIQYYANDKIVALWQKNHEPMLYVTGQTPSGKEYKSGDPLFLYMPEGSNELKAW